MVDAEVALREELDRLAPTEGLPSAAWSEVLARAGVRAPRPASGRRRGRLLIALTVLLVALVAVLSLAASQDWWFFRFGQGPQPVSAVAVVSSGGWQGIPWELTAYRSRSDGICFALTPRPAGAAAGSGAAIDCDTITGVPRTAQTKPSKPHGITYLTGVATGGFPHYIVGMVVAAATRVEVVVGNGTPISTPTIAAPASLQSRVRFYAVQLPPHARVLSVRGKDAGGKIVASLAIPAAISKLASPDAYAVSGGTRLRLSHAMQHMLRLHHMSPIIYLLGTRFGLNFYRRGTSGHCYGSGPAGNPGSFTPTQAPRAAVQIFGGYVCSPRFPSPAQPVLDTSVWGQNRGRPTVTLLRLVGFASDAVKAIRLLDAHGRILATVPVVNNIYALRPIPKGVVALEPIAAHGTVLARCGPNGAGSATSGQGSYLNAHC